MNISLLVLSFSLLTSFFNLTDCQQELSLTHIPQEMHYYIATQNLQPADISALKQTCTELHNSFDYWMLNREIIEKIDETVCTKALCSFARTKQNVNVSHFFNNNNTARRKDALALLGWQFNDYNDEQLMQAHCVGLTLKKVDWVSTFKRSIAITMICLSDNPNIQDKDGDTALIWASKREQVELIKLLLIIHGLMSTYKMNRRYGFNLGI